MAYIDGKIISENIARQLKVDFFEISKKKQKKVSLGVFIVGDDPVIESFVKIKKTFAQKVGVDFEIIRHAENTSEKHLIESLHEKQRKFDGVIVQLPLPTHINKNNILTEIDKNKDVDLLNSENIKEFKDNASQVTPPVAGAIWKIIESVKYNLGMKKAVIIGKGELTGKPFSQLLENKGFTCGQDYYFIDIETPEKERIELLKTADVIVSGTGVPNLITKDLIKEGVFLIDAGTSTANKKLVGDISLDCVEKSQHFSKTPGGVGPVTVAVLYENLLQLVIDKNSYTQADRI